jgi:mannan endo-1,4-beta-mannosidase
MPPKPTSAPRPTLYVSGRFLNDRKGDRVILRGVNLPLLDDWRFPGADYLDQVAQTGANAVRLQWYVNYPDATRPPYSVSDLDDVLTRCTAAGMIPILQLADLTCQSDATQLNAQLIPWWTSTEVVALLNGHAEDVIINLANELGAYHWADDSDQALQTYLAAYTEGLASIRNAGLAMPVMIDAPDCGTSLDAFTSVGQSLVKADPAHNLLLSVHAYWAATDYSSTIRSCIDLDLPLVCGEISNRQDDTDDDGKLVGYYDLDGTTKNVAAPSGVQVPDPAHGVESRPDRLAGLGLGTGRLRRAQTQQHRRFRPLDALRPRYCQQRDLWPQSHGRPRCRLKSNEGDGMMRGVPKVGRRTACAA